MKEEERLKQEIIQNFPSATFVTAKVLRRPPFAFIHALVRSVVDGTDGFAENLLDDENFDSVSGMKKIDKVSILKILRRVSCAPPYILSTTTVNCQLLQCYACTCFSTCVIHANRKRNG